MKLKYGCFTLAIAGALLLPSADPRVLGTKKLAETVTVKDQARVIEPVGDGDQIIKRVPHVVLKRNATYVFSVSATPSERTLVMISRLPTASNLTSWQKVGESHHWPDEEKFELKSADVGEKLEVLVTVWGDVTQRSKGSSVPDSFPLKQPQTDQGTTLPHTFEFELENHRVLVTVSRK